MSKISEACSFSPGGVIENQNEKTVLFEKFINLNVNYGDLRNVFPFKSNFYPESNPINNLCQWKSILFLMF